MFIYAKEEIKSPACEWVQIAIMAQTEPPTRSHSQVKYRCFVTTHARVQDNTT